jgi:hypothetical protein
MCAATQNSNDYEIRLTLASRVWMQGVQSVVARGAQVMRGQQRWTMLNWQLWPSGSNEMGLNRFLDQFTKHASRMLMTLPNMGDSS